MISSPEGLSEQLEGVGAIPLGPVVVGLDAVSNDGLLRKTLRRILGGGEMSTLPYIS